MHKKTILIPILQGVAGRNILRTDIFRLLQKPWLRVVLLLSSEERIAYYRRTFYGERIEYAVVPRVALTGIIDRAVSRLKVSLLRTGTMDVKRRMLLDERGKNVHYIISFLFNRLFGHRVFVKLLQWFDSRFVHTYHFDEIFKTYKPDMVFTANLFSDTEAALVREAKQHAIRTVGIVNSWDKLTSRSVLRTVPDLLLVHNDIMREEAVRYSVVHREKICVVGVPHFDIYARPPHTSKQEFFKRLGADEAKPLILFAPLGRSFADVDGELLDILTELRVKGKIPKSAQILVRFPPNDTVALHNKKASVGVFIERPGKRFSKERSVDWDMTIDEIAHLRDELQYIDILITYGSTLMIEAAILDKPIVRPRFDGRTPRKFSESAIRYDGYTHFAPLLRVGGIAEPEDTEELAASINRYLTDPSIHSAGRRRIAETQGFDSGGRASERVASIIHEVLQG